MIKWIDYEDIEQDNRIGNADVNRSFGGFVQQDYAF